MDRIHFATAALNQTPLDWRGNLARCVRAIEVARERGASVLVLPELALGLGLVLVLVYSFLFDFLYYFAYKSRDGERPSIYSACLGVSVRTVAIDISGTEGTCDRPTSHNPRQCVNINFDQVFVGL